MCNSSLAPLSAEVPSVSGLAARRMSGRPHSRKVNCEAFKIGKRAVSESTLVRRAHDNTRRVASLECLLPARGTEAPTVAGFQAREAKLWHRSGQIVAARFRKREKPRCHHSADGVAANVLMPGIAAAIAIKPTHGFERTYFQRLAEHVAGRNRSSASVVTFISKHALSPSNFSIEAASASLYQLKTPTTSAGTSWVEDSGCVPVRLYSVRTYQPASPNIHAP